MTVSIGDTVIYGKYGGSDIEVDGQTENSSRRRHPRQASLNRATELRKLYRNFI